MNSPTDPSDESNYQSPQSDFAESPEAFRHLVESVKDYAIFLLDKTGRISTWNAGAREFYGYESHEVMGQSVAKFFPETAVREGKPEQEIREAIEFGHFEAEGWRIRKDGT